MKTAKSFKVENFRLYGILPSVAVIMSKEGYSRIPTPVCCIIPRIVATNDLFIHMACPLATPPAVNQRPYTTRSPSLQYYLLLKPRHATYTWTDLTAQIWEPVLPTTIIMPCFNWSVFDPLINTCNRDGLVVESVAMSWMDRWQVGSNLSVSDVNSHERKKPKNPN